MRVTTELYGYAPGDRVYQGMTIAFDFSVEEIWVPLMAGATLVPGPAGTTLMGDELGDFLRERRVTVMACCPTSARHHRAGRAGPADPAGRRRGLPAKSRGPMVSPRPPHSQHLRPHRGDRHGDNDRATAGQAGHDRRTAPDLFDRHPRSSRGQDRSDRRARRDRYRGRRTGAWLHESR